MTRQQTLTITAIVTTLAENGGGPESYLYLATGMELNEWYVMKAALIASGNIIENFNWVELTPKGYELARKIEELRKAHSGTPH